MSDALGRSYEPLPRDLLRTGASVGLLLLGAYLAGRIMARLKLAMVTGYLLFGVFIGPDVLGIVSEGEIGYLTLANDLAISLIALTAGGEIRFSFIMKAWKRVVAIATTEIAGVAIGIAALMVGILPVIGLTTDHFSAETLALGAIIGTIAAANSPAVVIAVIAELKARGTTSQLALAITVCKDLLLVVMFTVVLAVGAGAVISGSEGSASEVAKSLAIHLGGSIVAGVIVGLIMAWYVHKVHAHLPFFLLFACFGIALLSEAFHLEALIVAVVAGMMMENIWPEESEPLFEGLEELSLPVYCVFFAVAGLKLDLNSLAELWKWAMLIVAARGVAVWASTELGARLTRVDAHERRWLWSAFVPQAGIAIALATIVQETFGSLSFGETLFNLLVSTIALNQLVGPVLFKFGLTRSDEEPSPADSRE